MFAKTQLSAQRSCTFVRIARRCATRMSSATASPRVRYSKSLGNSKLFYYTVSPPEDTQQITNVAAEELAVELTDLRNARTSLQNNGFELVKFPSGRGVDWEDTDQVRQIYYPEVEALLKRFTGADRVVIVNHGLRRGKIQKRPITELGIPGKEDPALLTHVDFTDTSGPLTMQYFAGADASELSKKPWAIVQVWRPLTGPVQDSPLGLIDAATLSPDDMLPVQIHLAGGMTHEVSFVTHNPKHRWQALQCRWYWTSQMQEDEAYVFVQYDSRDGHAKYSPHASIADSTIPEDAPKRQSIETRALIFFDS